MRITRMNDHDLQSTISNEELNKLELKHYEGEIVVVDRMEQVDAVRDELLQCKVLGFDTETRPAFKKGVVHKVALLQLSSNQRTFLIRINKIGLPYQISQILADESIVKTGVAIRDDIKTLQKMRKFTAGGFVELQEYVKDFQIESFSLKKLAGIVLGFRISKSQRLSNWESDTLSEGQRHYAATDSWVSLLIYQQLQKIHNKI